MYLGSEFSHVAVANYGVVVEIPRYYTLIFLSQFKSNAWLLKCMW